MEKKKKRIEKKAVHYRRVSHLPERLLTGMPNTHANSYDYRIRNENYGIKNESKDNWISTRILINTKSKVATLISTSGWGCAQ